MELILLSLSWLRPKWYLRSIAWPVVLNSKYYSLRIREVCRKSTSRELYVGESFDFLFLTKFSKSLNMWLLVCSRRLETLFDNSCPRVYLFLITWIFWCWWVFVQAQVLLLKSPFLALHLLWCSFLSLHIVCIM